MASLPSNVQDSNKNGSGGTFDSTGALGESGLAYRLVLDHEDEDYWRNYGVHRETLIAPSLAWYGRDTQVVLWYEYRDFLSPFDRGTVLDPRTMRPLDVPRTRRLDEPVNVMTGQYKPAPFTPPRMGSLDFSSIASRGVSC